MLQYRPNNSRNKGGRSKTPKNIFFLQKNTKNDEYSDEEEDEEDVVNSESGKMKKIAKENNHIYFHAEVNRDNIFELTDYIRKCEIDNIVLAHKLCCDPIPIYLLGT